jgi:ketosteroid isomerase-like protein
MSQENVEIVRRGYEAVNRGDIDGVAGLLAPHFEYVASGLVPASGACTGERRDSGVCRADSSLGTT